MMKFYINKLKLKNFRYIKKYLNKLRPPPENVPVPFLLPPVAIRELTPVPPTITPVPLTADKHLY